jgi:hypothetical protein
MRGPLAFSGLCPQAEDMVTIKNMVSIVSNGLMPFLNVLPPYPPDYAG